MTDYEKALAFVLRWEGGRVDDPTDRGGRTAYGVTQRTYTAYLAKQGKPSKDVFTITQAEVGDIYRTGYWDGVTTGRTWPLNAVLFDVAVNMGPGRAASFLEQAKRLPILPWQDRMKVLAGRVMNLREGYYAGIIRNDPSQVKYQRGWSNRCQALRTLTGL